MAFSAIKNLSLWLSSDDRQDPPGTPEGTQLLPALHAEALHFVPSRKKMAVIRIPSEYLLLPR